MASSEQKRGTLCFGRDGQPHKSQITGNVLLITSVLGNTGRKWKRHCIQRGVRYKSWRLFVRVCSGVIRKHYNEMLAACIWGRIPKPHGKTLKDRGIGSAFVKRVTRNLPNSHVWKWFKSLINQIKYTYFLRSLASDEIFWGDIRKRKHTEIKLLCLKNEANGVYGRRSLLTDTRQGRLQQPV